MHRISRKLIAVSVTALVAIVAASTAIAAPYGFGPADEQATRNAIHGRPITTTQDKKKSGRFTRAQFVAFCV